MSNGYYVYLYRNELGIPIYVGKGIRRRAWQHLKGNKYNRAMNSKIKRMTADGLNPQPEFICVNQSEELALLTEEYFVWKYGRRDLGTGTLYNLTNGGEGASGSKRSKESIERRTAALMLNEKWRKNQRLGMIDRTLNNKEWKKNVGEANRRKLLDPNWSNKLREASKKYTSDTIWCQDQKDRGIKRRKITKETHDLIYCRCFGPERLIDAKKMYSDLGIEFNVDRSYIIEVARGKSLWSDKEKFKIDIAIWKKTYRGKKNKLRKFILSMEVNRNLKENQNVTNY